MRLTVVKITTDQAGLYGYGCATFTQRADLVKPAVERYLKPFLLGKTTDRIEDIWQSCYDSSYWKNGPVLNNAISWHRPGAVGHQGPPGRHAHLPACGGKCREAADTYGHASGAEFEETVDSARKLHGAGLSQRARAGGLARHGRLRLVSATPLRRPPSLHDKPLFDREAQFRRALKLLEICRRELGDEVELLHDMHERLTPNLAVEFCKQAEPLPHVLPRGPALPRGPRLLPPDPPELRHAHRHGRAIQQPARVDAAHHRAVSSTSSACTSRQAGGFTPARKIAILAEPFGVRTAWHGPGDVSPVGHMANVTLDLVSYNFGIQEYSPFNDQTKAIFQGCPEWRDGYLWVSEKPGWGIEIDEKEAAKFPFTQGELNGGWGELRLPDGTVIKQ